MRACFSVCNVCFFSSVCPGIQGGLGHKLQMSPGVEDEQELDF